MCIFYKIKKINKIRKILCFVIYTLICGCDKEKI